MSILSIHHVSMVVADTAKALAFYHDILGLSIDQQRPDLGFPGVWLEVGEHQIHLLEVDNVDPVENRPEHGGRDRHLAMMVDNIETTVNQLDQAGIVFSRSKSGRKAIFCRDPDGNGIELIEAAS